MRCFLKSYEPNSTDLENGIPFFPFFNTSQLMMAMQLHLVYLATLSLFFTYPINSLLKNQLSASFLPYLPKSLLQYAAIGIISQFGQLSYLIFFFQLCDHNNDRAVFLPNHLPEIIHGINHGSLSCNESLLFTSISLVQKQTQKHLL